MPWGRGRLGNVVANGLVHPLFEWGKDGRMYWDTQCSLQWGNRDNVLRDVQPLLTTSPVSCLECITVHIRNGWAW